MTGVRQGGARPQKVAIDAGQAAVSGERISLSAESALDLQGDKLNLRAGDKAAVEAKELDLRAQVYIRGELLEDFIIRIVAAAMGGF